MTILLHFNRAKLKKRSLRTLNNTKITKGPVPSLLLVHYNLFLHDLLKEANREARNARAKSTKAEHVKAVAKRILKKYRR
ncbi:uncharacterized protein LOC131928269 [Physella acuta]|uniref:uncharacterized protein LOC131928269 n=1 Tax=Physella acuta TaxID=109671 RepID=UPI0027DDE41C|nr:uncharacterized protein LOC131928269 [Physella acuta]